MFSIRTWPAEVGSSIPSFGEETRVKLSQYLKLKFGRGKY